MSHLTRFLLVGALAVNAAGCGATRPTAALSPTGHLAGEAHAAHRPSPQGAEPMAPDNLDADPELAADRRRLLLEAALAAEGRTVDGAVASGEAALLSELFGPLHLDASPTLVGDTTRWIAHARPRDGRPRPGDLAVFKDAPATVAVVVEVPVHGPVEALAITRGAIRRIRLDPSHPGVRRADGAIRNTFLRPRHPDDGPRQKYLAGQLCTGFRTLLD